MTITTSETKPNQTYERIPLELIDDNPFWTRDQKGEALSDESIGILASSIETVGYIATAIPARRVAHGRVQISCGHRRLRALVTLGRKTMLCDFSRKLTDDDMMAVLVTENQNRVDPTQAETDADFAHMVVIHGTARGSRGKIAAAMGVSETQCTGLMDIYQARKGRALKPDQTIRPADATIARTIGGSVKGVGVAADKKLNRAKLVAIRTELQTAESQTKAEPNKVKAKQRQDAIKEARKAFIAGDVPDADTMRGKLIKGGAIVPKEGPVDPSKGAKTTGKKLSSIEAETVESLSELDAIAATLAVLGKIDPKRIGLAVDSNLTKAIAFLARVENIERDAARLKSSLHGHVARAKAEKAKADDKGKAKKPVLKKPAKAGKAK